MTQDGLVEDTSLHLWGCSKGGVLPLESLEKNKRLFPQDFGPKTKCLRWDAPLSLALRSQNNQSLMWLRLLGPSGPQLSGEPPRGATQGRVLSTMAGGCWRSPRRRFHSQSGQNQWDPKHHSFTAAMDSL